MTLLTLASASWAAELNYCVGVQTADDKSIYWTTHQSCKDHNHTAGLEWWSIRTISESTYRKVVEWAKSSPTTDQKSPWLKFCAAINALDGNEIYWTTHQTCEHYNNDVLARLEWWSINQITGSDYARFLRSSGPIKTTSSKSSGYCFDDSQRIYYKSKSCLGRDLNITKQEYDNKRLKMVWCATQWSVSLLGKSACLARVGKSFPDKASAEVEHKRLKGVATTSSTASSSIQTAYCYKSKTRFYYVRKGMGCGYDKTITKQEFDNKHHKKLSTSITASYSPETAYCYDSELKIWYKYKSIYKERRCIGGDKQISKAEFDNRKIVSTVGANDERKHASTAAQSYSNNLLGYCYDPPTQLFYIKDAAECAGSDLEITKQEFKNKTISSATFRFLDGHWLRAHCLGNVEFPCRFRYEIRTDKNIRIVIQTKQGEIIFPDGSTYIGPFDRGMWHGHGTYTFSDKRKYAGQFKDGRAHGQGVFILSDGARFDGVFRNGKKWWGDEFDKYGNVVSSISNGKRHPKLR